MLYPDVTEILDDPEVGGGVSFTVNRIELTRVRGSYTKTTVSHNCTGNIQPVSLGISQNGSEDAQNEEIVIRSTFAFQVGSNDSSGTTGPDEVLYKNKRYRVTRVEDYSDWGFTVGYATRVRE